MFGLNLELRPEIRDDFKNNAIPTINDGMSMLSASVANTYRADDIPNLNSNTPPTCGPSDRISEEIHDNILSNSSGILNVLKADGSGREKIFRDSITNKSINTVNNLMDISYDYDKLDFEDQMLIASCNYRQEGDYNPAQFDNSDDATHPHYIDKLLRDASINWYETHKRFTQYTDDEDDRKTRLKELFYARNNDGTRVHSASIVDVFTGNWLLPPLPIDGAPKNMDKTFRVLNPIFKRGLNSSWLKNGTPLFLCSDFTADSLDWGGVVDIDPSLSDVFPFSSLTMNDMLFMTHISAMNEHALGYALFLEIDGDYFYDKNPNADDPDWEDPDWVDSVKMMSINANTDLILPDIWVRRSIVINIIVANYIYYKTLLHTAQSVSQDTLLRGGSLDRVNKRRYHYNAIKLLGKLYVNKFRIQNGSVRSVVFNDKLNHSPNVITFIQAIRRDFEDRFYRIVNGNGVNPDDLRIKDNTLQTPLPPLNHDIDIICDQSVVANAMRKVGGDNNSYLNSRSEGRKGGMINKEDEKINMEFGINAIFKKYIDERAGAGAAATTEKKNIKRITWSTLKYLGDKSLYVTAMHGQELQKKYTHGTTTTPGVATKADIENYYNNVLNFLRQKLAPTQPGVPPAPPAPPPLKNKNFSSIIRTQKWSLLLSERPQFIRSMMSLPQIDRVLMDGVKMVKQLNHHILPNSNSEYIDIMNITTEPNMTDISAEFDSYKTHITNLINRRADLQTNIGGYIIPIGSIDIIDAKKKVQTLKIIKQGLNLIGKLENMNNEFIFEYGALTQMEGVLEQLREGVGTSRTLNAYCQRWERGRLDLVPLEVGGVLYVGDNKEYKYRSLLKDLNGLGIMYGNIVQMVDSLNSIGADNDLENICTEMVGVLGTRVPLLRRFIAYSDRLFREYFVRENKVKNNEDIAIILKNIAECSKLTEKEDGTLDRPDCVSQPQGNADAGPGGGGVNVIHGGGNTPHGEDKFPGEDTPTKYETEEDMQKAIDDLRAEADAIAARREEEGRMVVHRAALRANEARDAQNKARKKAVKATALARWGGQYTLNYFSNFLKKLGLDGKIYNQDNVANIDLAIDFIDNINIPDENIVAVIKLLREMVSIVNSKNSIIDNTEIKKILCVGPIFFCLDDKNECIQVKLKDDVVNAINIYRMILNRGWDEENDREEQSTLDYEDKILEKFQDNIAKVNNMSDKSETPVRTPELAPTDENDGRMKRSPETIPELHEQLTPAPAALSIGSSQLGGAVVPGARANETLLYIKKYERYIISELEMTSFSEEVYGTIREIIGNMWDRCGFGISGIALEEADFDAIISIINNLLIPLYRQEFPNLYDINIEIKIRCYNVILYQYIFRIRGIGGYEEQNVDDHIVESIFDVLKEFQPDLIKRCPDLMSEGPVELKRKIRGFLNGVKQIIYDNPLPALHSAIEHIKHNPNHNGIIIFIRRITMMGWFIMMRQSEEYYDNINEVVLKTDANMKFDGSLLSIDEIIQRCLEVDDDNNVGDFAEELEDAAEEEGAAEEGAAEEGAAEEGAPMDMDMEAVAEGEYSLRRPPQLAEEAQRLAEEARRLAEDLIYDGDFLIKKEVLAEVANTRLVNPQTNKTDFNLMCPVRGHPEHLDPERVENRSILFSPIGGDNITFDVIPAGHKIGMGKYLTINITDMHSLKCFFPEMYPKSYLNRWGVPPTAMEVDLFAGHAVDDEGEEEEGDQQQVVQQQADQQQADILKPIAEYVDTQNIISDIRFTFYPNENRKMYFKYLLGIFTFAEQIDDFNGVLPKQPDSLKPPYPPVPDPPPQQVLAPTSPFGPLFGPVTPAKSLPSMAPDASPDVTGSQATPTGTWSPMDSEFTQETAEEKARLDRVEAKRKAEGYQRIAPGIPPWPMVMFYDATEDRTPYYYNREEKVSTPDLLTGKSRRLAAVLDLPAQPPFPWLEFTTAETNRFPGGQRYYYNVVTHRSQWAYPIPPKVGHFSHKSGGSQNISRGKLNNKKTKKNRRIKKNTKRNKKNKRNKSKKNKTRRKKVKGKKKTIKRV